MVVQVVDTGQFPSCRVPNPCSTKEISFSRGERSADKFQCTLVGQAASLRRLGKPPRWRVYNPPPQVVLA